MMGSWFAPMLLKTQTNYFIPNNFFEYVISGTINWNVLRFPAIFLAVSILFRIDLSDTKLCLVRFLIKVSSNDQARGRLTVKTD